MKKAFRAKDEIRTRDPDLGKVVLYQLSYFRIWMTTSVVFLNFRKLLNV
jgi:hypothetical protein